MEINLDRIAVAEQNGSLKLGQEALRQSRLLVIRIFVWILEMVSIPGF